MAVDHRVGFGVVQLLGRFALLSFLREDAHAPAVQVLNQPGVMHIQARICAFLAGPAVPGHAAGLPSAGGTYSLHCPSTGKPKVSK